MTDTNHQRQTNPYADALRGLKLTDPVEAFFSFCRERERIRVAREQGQAAPWSQDLIFQRGRFLNVFREDDRVSRALLRFIGETELSLSELVRALFFARWCNRQSTLDALSLDMLQAPQRLQSTLLSLPQKPWCNRTAYPVGPVLWEGRVYPRLEAATALFERIKEPLTALLTSAQGDVRRATDAINQHFRMDNDFPIFMAVMDVAWFRPDVIDPASPVPTGIGAEPYLDLLQEHLGCETHQQTCAEMMALQPALWPEAKRPLQPIDVEYLSCECRKYYSYVNGTKTFEGKNRFIPGQSPREFFDIRVADDLKPTLTHIHVIAGGPCSGKSTLVEALRSRGYHVVPETAEVLLQAEVEDGGSAAELRADPIQWQRRVLEDDHRLFESLPTDSLVFTDTSVVEDLVFAERAGLEVGPNLRKWLTQRRYRKVFFLSRLQRYRQSAVRLESREVADQISVEVRRRYQELGYAVVELPDVSVQERVALIEAELADVVDQREEMG